MNQKFFWGSATASYQVEGAAFEGQKGLSIWDVFTQQKGKIYEGQTGDVACDHYHQMKEDVKRMAELGLKAYRFSISWPRIIPNGIGDVNEEGVRFYHELIEELLNYGITPFLTLYHWDYPYELHKKGGWLNGESPEWFAYYTKIIAKEYGTKVKHFFTFNEPQVFVGLGYQVGLHAPGYTLDQKELLTISRNVMLAHGKSVKVLRNAISDCQIGYAPTCGGAYYPLSETQENISAAEKANMTVNDDNYLFSAALWNEPIVAGRLHPEWGKALGNFLTEADIEIIHQPLDFLGMNIYSGRPVSADKEGYKVEKLKDGNSRTAIGWPITPDCIKWSTYFNYKQYQLPIIISENGMSCHDTVSLDGKVHDPNRIDYIERHLGKLKESKQMGTSFLGYFYWSLMDNFEWANGYNDRFGLIYIDYETQERIPKDSYYFYQNYIQNNAF